MGSSVSEAAPAPQPGKTARGTAQLTVHKNTDGADLPRWNTVTRIRDRSGFSARTQAIDTVVELLVTRISIRMFGSP